MGRGSGGTARWIAGEVVVVLFLFASACTTTGSDPPDPVAVETPVASAGSRPEVPDDVFRNALSYRFVRATIIDRRDLRRHLRAVAPHAFQSVDVRAPTEDGERHPAAVAVAIYDVSPDRADAFKEETLSYLRGLDDEQEDLTFDGNGIYFETETIAAATFFVSFEPVLLVHVVGQPPVDIEALARGIYTANV